MQPCWSNFGCTCGWDRYGLPCWSKLSVSQRHLALTARRTEEHSPACRRVRVFLEVEGGPTGAYGSAAAL